MRTCQIYHVFCRIFQAKMIQVLYVCLREENSTSFSRFSLLPPRIDLDRVLHDRSLILVRPLQIQACMEERKSLNRKRTIRNSLFILKLINAPHKERHLPLFMLIFQHRIVCSCRAFSYTVNFTSRLSWFSSLLRSPSSQ